jgi:hypothetical protein
LTVTQIFATPGKLETDNEALHAVGLAISRARQQAGLATLSRNPRLDQMAKEQLASLTSDPNPSNLKEVGLVVATKLAAAPIADTARVSVGAQVIVDSSQFAAEGAVLSANARFWSCR